MNLPMLARESSAINRVLLLVDVPDDLVPYPRCFAVVETACELAIRSVNPRATRR